MDTATRSLPHCNSVKIGTSVIDISIHERNYDYDGSTEIDLNHGQISIELYADGRVGVSPPLGQLYVEFDSLESFIDALLREGDR